MANKPYEMEKSTSEYDLSDRKARGWGISYGILMWF